MNENKLYKLLNGFFISTNGTYEEFKEFYEGKFGWKFEEDCYEDAPVIVSLS
jgi:predicted enzyme related to lactoylglutathione lyase